MSHPFTHRWRRGLVASLAVAAVLSPSAAHADWSGPDRVSEDPSDEPTAVMRGASDIAIAPDGSQWFTWVASTEKGTFSSAATYWVYAAHRPAGGTWQAPTLLSTFGRTAGTQYPSIRTIQLDVDGAGRPTIAWPVLTGPAGSNPPNALQVTTRSLGSDGTWTPATAFNQDPLTSATAPVSTPPAVEVNPDGQAAIAWQAGDGVHVVHRAADGTWAAESSAETTSTTQPVDTVGLGLDQEGRATLAWRSYDTATGTWDIKARTQNSTGTSWAGEAVTLADDVTTALRTSLAVDTSGAAVATWGSNEGARAAVRSSAAAVGSWSAPHELSTGTANAVGADSALTAGKGVPSATFDPYGTAAVIWPDLTGAAPTIKIATVSPSGQWGDPSVVGAGTSANPPVAPRITVGQGGRATATWSTSIAITPPATFSGGTVQATTRADATAAWEPATTYVDTENPSAYSTLTATGLANGAGATIGLSGDRLGDVAAGWTSYYSSATQTTQQPQTLSFTAGRSPGLEWTARGVGGASNIRSWLGYIKGDWTGSEACTAGVHGIEVSDGAVLPSADDDTSWRFTQSEAYKDATGKTIVQYHGTLRWALQAHCIDIKIANPRLEIAADGTTARLYADGETSGSMQDAIDGHAQQVPFTNLRILDLDLSHSGPRVNAGTNAWVSAPATLYAGFASKAGLDLYSGNAFGFLTVVAPTGLKQKATTTLTASGATYGAAATVTATIPGATGDVTLSGAGDDLTAPLDSGTATFHLPPTLAAGDHELTATYAGDDTYGAATAFTTLTVVKATPAVTVSAPASVTVGTAITVTVSVPGSTGTVTLTGAGTDQSADLQEDGTAAFTLPGSLAVGAYALTATYAGDDNHIPASNTHQLTLTQPVVNQPPSSGQGDQPAPVVKLTPSQQKVANAQAKVAKTTTAIARAKAAAKAAKKAHHKAQATKLAKKIAKLKKQLTKQKKALTKAKAAAKKASKKH